MFAVYGTLVVFTVSLVIVRVATVGLTMTGVSKDLAQFQALSAFTGAGFTTTESEDIVNHPLRRRIVMHLMLLGHVGIVVAIPTQCLALATWYWSFVRNSTWIDAHGYAEVRYSWLLFAVGLVLGLTGLWLASSTRRVPAILSKTD